MKVPTTYPEGRLERMATLDSYPTEIRLLVHEYGFKAVWTFMKAGVVSPKKLAPLLKFSRDFFKMY